MKKAQVAAALAKHYKDHRHEFELFRNAVRDYFDLDPVFKKGHCPTVHSIKSRLKDVEHLRKKILRKWDDHSTPFNEGNLFKRITDLAGVRVLHLYQNQFKTIHEAIQKKIESKEWVLGETPVANSWDPEAGDYFRSLGLKVSIRDTYYTSVHYLIKPPTSSSIVCELQVRTLFEEIWGEIDHSINYPKASKSVECKEQIRVLAKLVSTGSRLGDAIFRSHANYLKSLEKKKRRR